MDCNKELVVDSKHQICKTIFYSLEKVSDKPSITVRGERLDFRNLLARASAGILDLNMFSLPRSCDIKGNDASEDNITDLLNRPSSVMDNLFGASVEDAEREMIRHKSVLSEEIKKQQPAQPASDPSPATASE